MYFLKQTYISFAYPKLHKQRNFQKICQNHFTLMRTRIRKTAVDNDVFKHDMVGSSVVHPDPDPAGSEIICKLGSGSVINSGSYTGFESGSKLSSASN